MLGASLHFDLNQHFAQVRTALRRVVVAELAQLRVDDRVLVVRLDLQLLCKRLHVVAHTRRLHPDRFDLLGCEVSSQGALDDDDLHQPLPRDLLLPALYAGELAAVHEVDVAVVAFAFERLRVAAMVPHR